MFKNPILDDFFVLRRNHTELRILKQMICLLCLWSYFEKTENTINEENNLLNNNFYKIGFIDGTKIAVEAKKVT